MIIDYLIHCFDLNYNHPSAQPTDALRIVPKGLRMKYYFDHPTFGIGLLMSLLGLPLSLVLLLENNFLGTVVSFSLFLSGFIMITNRIFNKMKTVILLRHGNITEALVVKKDIISSGDYELPELSDIYVGFTSLNRQEIKTVINTVNVMNAEVGMHIRIIYLPWDPSEAQIINNMLIEEKRLLKNS